MYKNKNIDNNINVEVYSTEKGVDFINAFLNKHLTNIQLFGILIITFYD